MPRPLPYFQDDGLGPLPRWLDREEAAQVAEVARLEAARCGFDPEAAASEAIRDLARPCRRERPASEILVRPEWLAEAAKVVGFRRPALRTARERANFTRHQMILALALAGFPQRRIAEEFGMAHSRVAALVGRMKRRAGIA